MSQFFMNMGQFVLQATVILVFLILLISFIASLVAKDRESQTLTVKNLNKKYKAQAQSLRRSFLHKKQFKSLLKKEKKEQKAEPKERPTLFVLDFDGDIKASATEHLREEISTLLMVAKPTDQVLIRLESPGGMVHGYGLAASQLQRIKDKGIPLVASVDKIAASGGYMMASVADTILSAPFAIIGSIGVIASVPNFNKLLKKNDIDYLEITAGEFKRTLTPLGEITEPKMKKFKEQIEDVHDLFKKHVQSQRPAVDLEKVATGEYWYGLQSKELGLVDSIGTSDDFILEHLESHRILSLKYEGKKTLKEKLAESMSLQIEAALTKVLSFSWRSIFQ